MALTKAQQDHVNKVFPECRAQMAIFLERGVDVLVFLQRECGDDVPPYAVAPCEEQDFWIGCWETPEQAVAEAARIGLQVIERTP